MQLHIFVRLRWIHDATRTEYIILYYVLYMYMNSTTFAAIRLRDPIHSARINTRVIILQSLLVVILPQPGTRRFSWLFAKISHE